MSFLKIKDQNFLVLGVSNKKSVGWAVAKTLIEEGANVYLCVRNAEREQSVSNFAEPKGFFRCDVEKEHEIQALGKTVADAGIQLHGIVHSIAFANYDESFRKFYDTKRADYLQASQISAFSLVEICKALKPTLAQQASVVTIGISSTDITAENYGYMAPIKASLNTIVRYLAKAFSSDTEVRFNAVNAGPLKTKASAGIPGYLKNYLYAEKLTYRKRALAVTEVADTVAYLLSPRSSGINAQAIVVNAGMDTNYFDSEIVEAATRLD
ncbi:MAG: SDR family oxidoreductase [Opitutales bacterium]|nr:SDR family oxidoreductase [Opitutales bacterium]